MSRWLLGACLLTLASSTFAVSDKGVDKMTPAEFARALKSLDGEFAATLERLKVPGMAVAIIKDDKVVLLKGYGLANVKEKRPVTPDTIFEIASCSKAFNSALVLFGVHEGKLALSDPPRKFLPSFHLFDPEADQHLTIADLMSHRSGLPRTDDAWASGELSTDECIRLLATSEPTYPYGLVGQYSNILVQTAGSVVSKAYGASWPDVLKTKILDPLGMASTTTIRSKFIDPRRMATGYRVNAKGEIEAEAWDHEQAIVAAGGVKSTVRDMANWVRFHLAGGSFEGKSLIAPGVLGEAYKPWCDYGDGQFAGLGWFLNDDRPAQVISHDGYLTGFQAYVGLVPERRLGFAILTNNSGRSGNFAAASLILDRLVGKANKTRDKELAKASGLYVDASRHHILRLFPRGKVLYACLDNERRIRLAIQGNEQWKTADARQAGVTVELAKEWRKQWQRVHVDVGGQRLEFARDLPYAGPLKVAEVMDRSRAAMGGKALFERTLAARYTMKCPTQGTSGEGLWYLGPDRQVGYLEQDYALGRPIFMAQVGKCDEGAKASQTNFRLDELSGNDVLDDWLVSEPVQELDWRRVFKKVEMVGEVDSLVVVRKIPFSGPEVLDYISPSTWLVVRREIGNVPVVERFDDFQSVDGYQIPAHILATDSQARTYEYRFTGLHFEVQIPHWAFHPIAWKLKD